MAHYEDDEDEDDEVSVIDAIGAIAVGVAIGAGIAAVIDMLSKSKKGGR